jgi:hypothetical protein
MKKIARHPSVAISAPPTTGPPDSPIDAPAAHMPTARARSRGSWKAWLSRINEHGTSTAAPSPCNARAPIRTPSDGASPQSADAAVNSANPPTTTRRAPTRSPNAPADRMNAANMIV